MANDNPTVMTTEEPSSTVALAMLSPTAHAREATIVVPFGVPGLVAALISMAVCYGSTFVASLFEIPSLGMNPHLQAVIMWGFAVLAVYALWRDRKHHRSNIPMALGAIAVIGLIITLYVRYDAGVERLAYVLLVLAAMVNLIVFLGSLNRKVLQQARKIETLNQNLEQRVESQVQEIDRLSRLKQFLSPQVADLVVSEGKNKLLDTHRRYIACLFCDIRGFTAVSEAIEPEEVIAILQVYHDRLGRLVIQHNGTIGFRSGDGLMAFFNDPIPCNEPVFEAVKLGLEIRATFDEIRAPWTKLGHRLGLGLGIASGYATMGLVGFRSGADYTAIGGVVNVASRLCDKAEDGQLLVSQRAYVDIESRVRAQPVGPLELKGVRSVVETYNIVELCPSAD